MWCKWDLNPRPLVAAKVLPLCYNDAYSLPQAWQFFFPSLSSLLGKAYGPKKLGNILVLLAHSALDFFVHWSSSSNVIFATLCEWYFLYMLEIVEDMN